MRLLNHHSERLGRKGAIAIVTAVCAPILVIIVGFVVDYGYASYINQRLARATDAATLGSVSQTAATAGGGYGDLDFLQTTGTNYFNANTAQLGLTNVNFSLSVTSDGAGGVVANGSYKYNVPTFFAGIIGINNIPVSGSASTSARPLTYVNYYILVDTSQSMGIAATQADMNALYQRVVSTNNGTISDYPGCVFGCHVLGVRPNGSFQTATNESLAHTANPPIQLRIDAAVTAIKSIISQAQSIAGTTRNIKFGLYTIQQDPASLTTVRSITPPPANYIMPLNGFIPPSSDYAALQVAASTIELGNNNYLGRGDSNFSAELTSFNAMLIAPPNAIATNGNGASATSPLNYFFIITDGVTDTYGPCNGGYQHCTSSLDNNYCTLLKTKGTVGVIYTIFSPIWDSNNPAANKLDKSYSDLVVPFSSQIKPALQSCATSLDYYFEANDGPDIVAQTQALFSRTQPSSARITQ